MDNGICNSSLFRKRKWDKMKNQKKIKFYCCNCRKNCSITPKIWVSWGRGVSAHSCFCSGECFFEAVEEAKRNFLNIEKLKGENQKQ